MLGAAVILCRVCTEEWLIERVVNQVGLAQLCVLTFLCIFGHHAWVCNRQLAAMSLPPRYDLTSFLSQLLVSVLAVSYMCDLWQVINECIISVVINIQIACLLLCLNVLEKTWVNHHFLGLQWRLRMWFIVLSSLSKRETLIHVFDSLHLVETFVIDHDNIWGNQGFLNYLLLFFSYFWLITLALHQFQVVLCFTCE